MPTPQPTRVISTPGIKRDATVLEGDNYIDGQWCRFTARGLPKKIAGYQTVTQHLNEIVRGMDSFTSDLISYLHLGSQDLLTQIQVAANGALGSQNDRTPISFATNVNNLWQFDQMQNKITGRTVLIAHAAQSLADISNSAETPIYYGNVDDTTPLVVSGMNNVSGGIVAVPPYLLGFSNGGRVDISPINDPTSAVANSDFVTQQKIVRGLSLRGQTPAAVLWSLDSVITAVFDPTLTSEQGLPVFDFNTVDGESSILSEQGVVQYDSIYYWVGVDRFLMFNGIVQELPNNMNIDFFFSNLNFAQRQKVFAFKVPRWGEIWWCFPSGSATECNHAVVYNVRLRTWYDTPLPDGGRSAGVYAKVYNKPFMCDVDLTSTGYSLWQHETGLDKVVTGQPVLPIDSWFQTHEISPLLNGQTPIDKAYRVSIAEPDFNQEGELTMTVFSRANARVAQVAVGTVAFPDTPTGPGDQVNYVKANARLLSFKFESNTPGGDFELGHTLAHIEPSDSRMVQ